MEENIIFCRKCKKQITKQESNKNIGYCDSCRELYKDEIEEEIKVDTYTNGKVISFFFPILGFLGAIIHIENRALSKLFTSYSLCGYIVYILILLCVICSIV